MIVLLKVAALLLLVSAGIGCKTGQPGRIMADTPALPYQAPDVEELSGTEADDADPDDAEDPAQNPQP